MRAVTVFLISVAFVSANPSKTLLKKGPGGRIIGGQVANTLQFPFAAAINVQTPDSRHFCSGTLLSNQWILTAGQCVDRATLFQISLGSIFLTKVDPNRIQVATSEYVLHPDYNNLTLENDIGLIMLRLPITFTDYIKPIERLPISGLPNFVASSSWGWGQVSDADSQLSDTLQWVVVTTLTNEECAVIYQHQVTDTMVCVEGNFNQGTCFGDVGSSLIQYYSTGHSIPVGISSFMSQNGCESTDPSGFTRVYPYNNWIRNVTGLAL